MNSRSGTKFWRVFLNWFFFERIFTDIRINLGRGRTAISFNHEGQVNAIHIHRSVLTRMKAHEYLTHGQYKPRAKIADLEINWVDWMTRMSLQSCIPYCTRYFMLSYNNSPVHTSMFNVFKNQYEDLQVTPLLTPDCVNECPIIKLKKGENLGICIIYFHRQFIARRWNGALCVTEVSRALSPIMSSTDYRVRAAFPAPQDI